jgi:electron transport complex protein RnfA
MSVLAALVALAALAVFSGLSLNLLLQFGLGIRELVDLAGSRSPARKRDWGGATSPGWIVVFLTALILWFFFTYTLIPPAFGFLESFLILPSTLLVSTTLNMIFAYFFPGGKITLKPAFLRERPLFALQRLIKRAGISGGLFSDSSCNGLALASLFISLRLALSPAEALALTLGFSLGTLLAAIILREINRRSSLEAVPKSLRGAPLTLISMGLLSLIFSSVSAILLRVLGVV